MANPIVCIGSAWAIESYHLQQPVVLASANISEVEQSTGGVCKNVAHQLTVFGAPIELITVFGNEAKGKWLRLNCENTGISIAASVFTTGESTGKYTEIINKDGSLFTAVLTNSNDELITPAHLHQHANLLSTASYLVADATLSIESLQWLIQFSNLHNVPVVIHPVNGTLASKLTQLDLAGVYLLHAKAAELAYLTKSTTAEIDPQVAQLLEKGVKYVWVNNGVEGSTLYNLNKNFKLKVLDVDINSVVRTEDALIAGWLLGKWLSKEDNFCLQMAHTLAAEATQTKSGIVTNINLRLLFEAVEKRYS
jgi:pseudouridine kinase